jgi:DNA-binding transcriptional regulator YiaG
MSDLKQVLTDEIRRLARKEVKLAVQPLQANIVALRRQISELKKLYSDSCKQVEHYRKKAEEVTGVELVEEAPKLRLNAAGIIRIRTKLKLTQTEFAQLLGVSMHTVSSWEIGKSYPRAGVKAKICALRTVGKRQIKAMLAQEPADAE